MVVSAALSGEFGSATHLGSYGCPIVLNKHFQKKHIVVTMILYNNIIYVVLKERNV